MALTLAQFEKIDAALSDVLRQGDFATCADPRAHIRSTNVLLDACIDAGMSYDHPRLEDWASVQVSFYLAGPIKGLWAGSGYALAYEVAA